MTSASVTPAQAGVQKLLDSFLLARKDVGKRCFLRASAFSSGESADLRQIENSGSSGELTVSIWFLVRLPWGSLLTRTPGNPTMAVRGGFYIHSVRRVLLWVMQGRWMAEGMEQSGGRNQIMLPARARRPMERE